MYLEIMFRYGLNYFPPQIHPFKRMMMATSRTLINTTNSVSKGTAKINSWWNDFHEKFPLRWWDMYYYSMVYHSISFTYERPVTLGNSNTTKSAKMSIKSIRLCTLSKFGQLWPYYDAMHVWELGQNNPARQKQSKFHKKFRCHHKVDVINSRCQFSTCTTADSPSTRRGNQHRSKFVWHMSFKYYIAI